MLKGLTRLRSLTYKLVLLILPLSLLPLVGISLFSYYVAQKQITEDRIILYVQQIAKDISSNIRLNLLEKMEETVSMSLNGEFRNFLLETAVESPRSLMDKLILVHEVYDLIILVDTEGRIVELNGLSRNSRSEFIEYLSEEKLEALKGRDLTQFTPPGSNWLREVRSRHFGYINWHRSALVHSLYNYEGQDIARHYAIGFAAPVLDDRNVVVGGVVAFMNWSFVQEILDKVEEDFANLQLDTGYAFLFGRDHNTIIGHKYRRNRSYPSIEQTEQAEVTNNYGTRLIEDHHLSTLQSAVENGQPYHEYEYPPGTPKISGLEAVDHEFFRWVCGVGINDFEIFQPVFELRTVMIWAASLTIVVVIILGYSAARRITIPLKRLTRGAKVISGGDFSQRVEVSGHDEIGDLAETFNEMAHSLEERSQALIELNRSLEEKVIARTRQLEQTNLEVQKAYDQLKQAQSQLVQSEKMASLGQLVAGIAHEIKNPLNFIYGNTEFLRAYVDKLTKLVDLYEKSGGLEVEAARALADFKQQINYQFMLDDLKTLIANFEEGAKRIHDIIGDLRTFSRMDSDDFKRVNIHETIDLAVSLLQNEYRGRIEIRRTYGELPEVECHPGKLNQVFMNILSNACHAIEKEGEITISTRQADSSVLVEIADTGAGITEENMKKIFEPFFTTKPVGEGTGLGLSISYAVIQQHGGRIEAASTPGQGTTFSIFIPVDHE